MASAEKMKTVATRRAVRRNRHCANTPFHYRGPSEVPKLCRENMWHGVHQAIIERHARTGGYAG